VTIPEGGGCARRACLARAAPVILLTALTAAPAALASDGDLQRVLLEQGCLEPKIETILQQGRAAYRANCLGSSHKTIVIVCSDGRCRSGAPVRERER
jgi:hypothetical protein